MFELQLPWSHFSDPEFILGGEPQYVFKPYPCNGPLNKNRFNQCDLLYFEKYLYNLLYNISTNSF